MNLHLPLHSRLYFWALFILFSGILAACSIAPAQNNAASILHIRVVMDNNYPPYAFMNEQGEMQGILVDQWKLWEERTGVKVEIIGLPWDQALGGMKNGEFDVIDTIFQTNERVKIFDFTKPYANIDVHIFFPSNVSGIANVESLKGFRVAVKTGDANADYLIEHGVTDLVYYDSYEDIIKAAANKKETIFVIDQPPALYFLYKYAIQGQFNYSERLYGGEFHRAVKKGNTALLEIINSGFANISAVQYQDIDDRWFGINQYASITRIIPYLGIGVAAAALLITILAFFNWELQTRVKTRTQELEAALVSLKSSETRFREAIEFLPIPLGIADNEGNIREFNRKFTEHYGYTVEDITTLSKWMRRAYPDPEYRESVIAQWDDDVREATRNQRTSPMREYKMTDKDGSLHDVEITMRTVGNLWITSFIEITERKRAETALREAETKYRALIENAPEVIYLDSVDEFSSNIYVSAQVEVLLGYTPAEISQNPRLWHEIVHPEDYQRALNTISHTYTVGSSMEEYRMTKRDGSVIWVRDTSIPILDENGKVIFIQGFLQDITERKKAEERLKESEERYRTLFEDSPIALLEEDFSAVKTYIDQLKEKGVEDLRTYFEENPREAQQCAGMVRVIDVNKAVIDWYEVNNKAELQVKLNRLMSADGYKSFIDELLALVEGGNHYELAISRRDREGYPLHIIINGTVVPNYEETWERVLVSIMDITNLKQVEGNLAKQLELLRGLRAIDQAIITNFDLPTNLNVLIDEIITQLHVDAVSISLFKNETLQFAAGQGFQTDAQTFTDRNIESRLAKQVTRERHHIHILNLQEMNYAAAAGRAIKEENFIAYYGVPLIANDDLLGVLEIFHRSMLNKDQDWLAFLDTLAGQAAITINSATLFNNLQTSNINLQLAYDTTLEGWSRALDLRDKETEGHTRRVTELTLQLAQEFNFSKEDLVHIKRGALLHDIGKMGIPDSILLKAGKLTDEEWLIMRKHPVYAFEMLSPIKYLEPALAIPHYHHEWWNGTGYPSGLKGEQIPLIARIFAIVDVWDALTSDRPYRAAWTKEKVREYLREGAGKQFDQRVVDIFLTMLEHDTH